MLTKVTKYQVILLSTFLGIIVSIAFVIGVSAAVEAHPGNTSSDGGHYCWTRCDYWGEVYGERHFHGGGSYIPAGPTLTEQGEVNGREHAEGINRAYIVEHAEAEADEDGFAAGSNGDLSSESPDYEVCDEEVPFSSPQDPEYADAFQASYSEACHTVYDDAYSTPYTAGYDRGEAIYLASDTSNDDTEKSDESGGSSNIGWIIALLFYGSPFLLGGIAWVWEEYGGTVKRWFDEA